MYVRVHAVASVAYFSTLVIYTRKSFMKLVLVFVTRHVPTNKKNKLLFTIFSQWNFVDCEVHVNKFISSSFKRTQSKIYFHAMEQRTLKNVNNYLSTNIYSYLETSGGQSSSLYLNVVHFFNASVK
jgi:hypothetical protein